MTLTFYIFSTIIVRVSLAVPHKISRFHAVVYRFWKMREFLVLADFVLFCFRRYSVILSASCTYRQSGCCVAAINSPLHAMNQCKPSMSPYKKFPGHLRDLESVVNRGSGARQYLFLNAVPIVCIVQSVSAILRQAYSPPKVNELGLG